VCLINSVYSVPRGCSAQEFTATSCVFHITGCLLSECLVSVLVDFVHKLGFIVTMFFFFNGSC